MEESSQETKLATFGHDKKRTTPKVDRQVRFLNAFREKGFNRLKAGEVAGVSPRTWRRWFKEDKDFKERVEEVYADVKPELFAAAYERALKCSDTLLIFMLKAADPLRFCEHGRKQRVSQLEMETIPMPQVIIQFPEGPPDVPQELIDMLPV